METFVRFWTAARPAQTAHAVAATITSIIDVVSGGSSAHVSNHAARPAPAQAAHPSALTARSSSSHAARSPSRAAG